MSSNSLTWSPRKWGGGRLLECLVYFNINIYNIVFVDGNSFGYSYFFVVIFQAALLIEYLKR
jgi:hypothetical protein